MAAQRIGILGGSFDPVHLGHLWIAESARETLSLDQIRWIPAATSPLKRQGPVASNEQRLQMLQLAIAGCPSFVVDDRELRRGEISYTVDTLAELRAEFPADDLFLIIGSDSLASIEQWRQPERLLQMATIVVVQRGGEPPIDFSVLKDLASAQQIQAAREHVLPMPIIELSSSDLRARVATGRSIRFRVPRPVEALIAAERIYQS